MPVVARHLMIHGRVQGVWYRAWTVDTAHRLGLVGWVRNRADGSVEAVVEGEEAAVGQFQALAHDGPIAAKVARIDATDIAATPFTTFEKRPTV
ncbi:acylphosphatase [Sphingobium sp. Leaf26]|uniref:acylphosphatase n=1 Tax=Sphingobium sp. Leaf26 TaxID=1735693 RepID=UPI0006FDDE08|nr:acylphosphatase [Sphingobium sp. Leaf26]KQN08640.1 acylphosphatase [Sphingobium sp. Leaf26]